MRHAHGKEVRSRGRQGIADNRRWKEACLKILKPNQRDHREGNHVLPVVYRLADVLIIFTYQ